MRIIVVLPTYNEAENLPRLVSVLFSLPLDLAILVVDDNSPDGTGSIADQLSEKIRTRHLSCIELASWDCAPPILRDFKERSGWAQRRWFKWMRIFPMTRPSWQKWRVASLPIM
jgi:cellulose synthase/poly-beta-1,6-N-acetylglucosamine synthase-like glycosyltransferase